MASFPAAPAQAALPPDWLDVLAQARSTQAGLDRIDEFRQQLAPGSVFSIQQNVTTAADPADEIRLRRFYSSVAGHYPVDGTKRKLRTPWTERLFLHGREFVGQGADVLARTFDDFTQARDWQLQGVVNVPLMQGNACFATFNVFGVRPAWTPQEVMAIRLLALAAARWVPVAPGLSYCFTDAPPIRASET
jgi:hypothetical protein